MDTASDGGERDALAPVIPLFGGDRRTPSATSSTRPRPSDRTSSSDTPNALRAGAGAGVSSPGNGAPRPSNPGAPNLGARSAWPSGAGPRADDTPDGSGTWHNTWTDDLVDDVGTVDEDAVARAEDAEAALLKRLRTRSLSEREASAFLRARELEDDAAAHIVDRMRRHGYLDDAALAEQLVHSGVERKGQGRVMLIQSLGSRGIPREVIDAALAELPDDEAERALEFARQKARTMRDLDRDTALRRLSGQLARRGYGANALSAARLALDELSRPARRPPAGTVRFE